MKLQSGIISNCVLEYTVLYKGGMF